MRAKSLYGKHLIRYPAKNDLLSGNPEWMRFSGD
jgi:hypothetical protein